MKVIYQIAASQTWSVEEVSKWRVMSANEQAERLACTKANIVKMAMKDMDCSEVDVMIQIVEE